MTNGIGNLRKWLSRADKTDWAEGQLAYLRYNQTLSNIAEHYGWRDTQSVVAAFVTLSPKNDYIGNLRSLVSVLVGVNKLSEIDTIKVSTYNHARNRAVAYAVGALEFDVPQRRLKIMSFYHNIVNPADNRWVTVDGHMHAAWLGDDRLTMEQARIASRYRYRVVAADLKMLAFENYLLPNQLQAIIWFTRKRVLRVKADLQCDLFLPRNDQWRSYFAPETIKPFT
jgi:hypothetical protein